MKKYSIIIIAILGFSMIFSSCKKYEEGPSFTLLTAKKRIVGIWTLNNAKYNNVEIDLNDMQALFDSFNLSDLDFDTEFSEDMPFDLSQISLKTVKLNLKKDETGYLSFEFVYGIFPMPAYSQAIKWEFSEKKDDLVIKVENLAEDQNFKILKLTKEDLYLERTDTNLGVASIFNFEFEKD